MSVLLNIIQTFGALIALVLCIVAAGAIQAANEQRHQERGDDGSDR